MVIYLYCQQEAFLSPLETDEEIEVVIEQGKTLIIKLQAVGDLNKKDR